MRFLIVLLFAIFTFCAGATTPTCSYQEDAEYHAGIIMYNFQYVFGSQEFITAMAQILSLLGGDITINPNYDPTHPNNTRGDYILSISDSDEAGGFIVDSATVAACGPGYFDATTSVDYNPEINDCVQDTIDALCVPVGRGYWSPGAVFDANTGDYIEYGLNRYACPDGTFSAGYGSGADSADDCVVDCPNGFAPHGYTCHAVCNSGVSHMHTSAGNSFTLFAERVTSPSLNISYNNTVCYLPLVSGRASNTIHVKYGDTIYHVE